MKTKISALLDGELDPDEAAHLFESSRDNPDFHDCCRLYPLIGDALRGESALGTDFTAHVMARLTSEPTVLAPRSRMNWQRPAWALAASLSGVAVVAWLALPQQHQAGGDAVLAKAEPATVKSVSSNDMQEYVIAHQAQSANLQFQGGTEHIRTVSLGYGK